MTSGSTTDRSFGVIPVRQQQGIRQYLLVQHHAGHWGFPKGHPDEGESPREAAERDLAQMRDELEGILIEADLGVTIVDGTDFVGEGETVQARLDQALASLAGVARAQARRCCKRRRGRSYGSARPRTTPGGSSASSAASMAARSSFASCGEARVSARASSGVRRSRQDRRARVPR